MKMALWPRAGPGCHDRAMVGRPPELIIVDGVTLRRHGPSDVAGLVAAVNPSAHQRSPWRPWAAQPATADSMTAFVTGAVPDFDSGRTFGYALVDPREQTIIGGRGVPTP